MAEREFRHLGDDSTASGEGRQRMYDWFPSPKLFVLLAAYEADW